MFFDLRAAKPTLQPSEGRAIMSDQSRKTKSTKNNVSSRNGNSLSNEPPRDTSPSISCEFNIVGVGASAGGLEAIEHLFEAMPEDTGAAFVVVQHLSPDFKSHMEELLARKTSMAIKRVTNEMPVEPNTIYLIPPNTEMMISDRRLLLTERERDEALNLPIDHFFRSLANDCGRKSIGVILSGTGSDGSRGIMAINEAGGLVLCQDEDTAKFDGMPMSAQETNAVHLVLPPEKIASAIDAYIDQSLSPENLAEQEIGISTETGIEEIFNLLRREYGIDFSLYKPTTVKRRIERRLALGKFDNVDAYAEQLNDDAEELNWLYKDLLIGVTQFFRDIEAFENLKSDIIPKIIEKKRNGAESIRIWVAGCATGEEAYSIAISFHEAMENERRPLEVKIFATDVHRKSLTTASAGIYPESSLGEMSQERIEKYFIKHQDGYEIIPAIREMIVFAPHNLVSDAPFTRMDLVTCRNMLIYLLPPVQKKVVSLFHFALRTGGYLFMGPSETPGDLLEEFEVENKKWRQYRKRRDVRLTTNIRLPLGGTANPRPFAARRTGKLRPTPETQMLATYDRLLDKHMAPSFLVDESGELVHSFGGAEKYLRFRGGRVTTNILELVHEDLKTSVAGALQHSAKEQKVVRYNGIRIQNESGPEQVSLMVDPIRDPRTEVIHTLISIEPMEVVKTAVDSSSVIANLIEDVDVSDLSREHITSLEHELRYTKENLQATVEELETSNEELQATNEELVASNEEMQSTNEELQSVNEELYTVNAEYQRKIGELTEMTDDMNNLFRSTDVGVIFLDRDLNIRRFTPRIAETFHLLPQDLGRPIQGFAHNIENDVFTDIQNVLETEQSVDREVRDRRQNNWLLRIIPYRTKKQVEGVVLTLVDINSIKETDAKLQGYRDLVEASDAAIIGTDNYGAILTWNPGAEAVYGYTAEEAIGKHISMLTPKELENETQEVISKARGGETIVGLDTQRLTKTGEVRDVMLNVAPVLNAEGKVTGFSSISQDYTERKIAEQEREKLATIIDSTSDFVGTCSDEGKTLTINPAGLALLGLPEDYEVEGIPIKNWHTEEEATRLRDEVLPQAIADGVWHGNTRIINQEGREIPLSTVIIAHKDDKGRLDYLSTVGRDITKELRLQNELQEREKFLRRTLDGLFTFAGVCLPDGKLIEANRTALSAAGVDPNDVLDKPFVDGHWWAYSEKVQDQLREAIKTAASGKAVRYDVDIQLVSGKFVTIDFQLMPLRNDSGEVTHLIPSAIDISERVALEAQTRVFSRAFDASLTAMSISDATMDDNPIIYVNPGFTKLTGYSAEEAVGRNCRFLQGKETDPKSVQKLRRAIRRGEACHVKLINYKKNGKKFWNELVITPVRNEQGELTHFVGVQFDMTDHQRVEDKLSRARDVAEAANAAKSSFVANMSHEIRTPLTTVVGMTEMLLDKETDKAKHDTLQMVYQSSRHLVTLINDVLDLSKIEAGKLEADIVDASPTQIIDDVVSSMSYRAGEKGLDFKVTYNGLIPDKISTDPIRFRQILFNLTGNAVKFTEEGTVSLSVKLIDRNRKPKLQIEVEDTGIGFDTREAEKLFEQFSQVDYSPTRRRGGTGLGLHISKRIADLLGATIRGEGKVGSGSKFTLILPTGDLDNRTFIDPTAQEKKTQELSTQDIARVTKLTGEVLVVEDTRGIRVLIKRMLENAGATVQLAADGLDAIAMIQDILGADASNTNPFAAIILDMHMPNLSGYETAQRLRELGVTSPIIALTASAMRGDREKCIKAGCDAYLTKPIDRTKLLGKIAELQSRFLTESKQSNQENK
jgi:two-component system CheB/CheR fusion protein